VCSVLVATAAVSLQSRQAENKLLDQRKKVLTVAGLLEEGESVSREEINRRFTENLEAHLVDLETGEYVDGADPDAYDQRKAAQDPARSEVAPPNKAKVRRLPDLGKIYLRKSGDEIQSIILPVEGYGLWSTLYGFLALDADTRTVEGIIFYEHGETPGLGGEVDNPNWKAKWPGRKAYDEEWDVALRVNKGAAGPPEEDPYRVDGLSGATITSNGVTNLVRFWLGENGFGPYLESMRSAKGIS
jgi:Na+-transporting NADH:ubiquinone oxidoreductase subunit C